MTKVIGVASSTLERGLELLASKPAASTAEKTNDEDYTTCMLLYQQLKDIPDSFDKIIFRSNLIQSAMSFRHNYLQSLAVSRVGMQEGPGYLTGIPRAPQQTFMMQQQVTPSSQFVPHRYQSYQQPQAYQQSLPASQSYSHDYYASSGALLSQFTPITTCIVPTFTEGIVTCAGSDPISDVDVLNVEAGSTSYTSI